MLIFNWYIPYYWEIGGLVFFLCMIHLIMYWQKILDDRAATLAAAFPLSSLGGFVMTRTDKISYLLFHVFCYILFGIFWWLALAAWILCMAGCILILSGYWLRTKWEEFHLYRRLRLQARE